MYKPEQLIGKKAPSFSTWKEKTHGHRIPMHDLRRRRQYRKRCSLATEKDVAEVAKYASHQLDVSLQPSPHFQPIPTIPHPSKPLCQTCSHLRSFLKIIRKYGTTSFEALTAEMWHLCLTLFPIFSRIALSALDLESI